MIFFVFWCELKKYNIINEVKLVIIPECCLQNLVIKIKYLAIKRGSFKLKKISPLFFKFFCFEISFAAATQKLLLFEDFFFHFGTTLNPMKEPICFQNSILGLDIMVYNFNFQTFELKRFWEDQNVAIIFFRRWGCMLCRLWAKEVRTEFTKTYLTSLYSYNYSFVPDLCLKLCVVHEGQVLRNK